MDVSGLCDLDEKKVEELLYILVFVWSPRSERWPSRTGMKKQIKTAKFSAMECGPGCNSWICNKWTAGRRAVVLFKKTSVYDSTHHCMIILK